MLPLASQAADYSARRIQVEGMEVIRLTDARRSAQVSVVPSIGNLAYEFKVNGKNAFWFPAANLTEFKSKPVLAGNPFLAPWANRLDQDAFYANGKKYLFSPDLGNLRRDQNKNPIHGLLAFSPLWQVRQTGADASSAWVTSRLEFWRYPDLNAQFPFAHTIEITYRLRDGVLEVETLLLNHSAEPMPVGIGYHPYFQVHDAPRDSWRVRLPVRERLVLSNLLIPTGERKPLERTEIPSLGGIHLDDVFTGLIRGEDGRTEFSVQGINEKVSVIYGPKYRVAVVYAPKGREFICFEPMAAITNAFNLAHEGKYPELQTVPPGGEWRESFWIRVTGF
jgi:aldose 1-epimerase